MRLLRWILVFVAMAAILYSAVHTREIKDAVVEQAPVRLGIQQKDWKHWSRIADQIQAGHLPDLNDKDWSMLKKLYNSTNQTVRDHAIDVIKLLEKTQYKDKAEEVKKG